MATWTQDPRTLRPMLATLAKPGEVPLVGPGLVFERKYDGIRCVAAAAPQDDAKLFSRNGIDKGEQFPEIAQAVATLARATGALVMDGEIVALDGSGEPTSFTALQGRLPRLRSAPREGPPQRDTSVRMLAFDLLRLYDEDLRGLPFTARRDLLERLMAHVPPPAAPYLALAESVPGNGEDLWQRAHVYGWEGLVVKQAQAPYTTGIRSSAWRKLKRTQVGTFLVGGFTEPKGSRNGLGAVVLGESEPDGRLRPVGSVGSGFGERALAALEAVLRSLETSVCPFSNAPVTATKAHWIKPVVQARVQFAERTPTGMLRHPVWLDWQPVPGGALLAPGSTVARQRLEAEAPSSPAEDTLRDGLVQTLHRLEDERRGGRLRLPGDHVLSVSNLHKVFWTDSLLTKGDLLRHYVRVSPFILPVVADRPLVMKRHPDGALAEAFYQHRAPSPLPKGARAASLPGDDVPSRLVGGDLYTLLYMAQLGTISQDPWFSRVQSPHCADFVAFDLDPMPDVPFSSVRDVALWLHEHLDRLAVPHFAKTSGASGLHVFVPLAEGTAYEPARLFTQLVATMISRQHAKVATVERSVAARGRTVYIDCLQNIEGKTLACAYSARASAYAGVSTPVSWDELEAELDPRAFTIETIGARLETRGDLWAETRTPKHRLRLEEVLATLARR